MIRTIEATIDPEGNVNFFEPVKLVKDGAEDRDPNLTYTEKPAHDLIVKEYKIAV